MNWKIGACVCAGLRIRIQLFLRSWIRSSIWFSRRVEGWIRMILLIMWIRFRFFSGVGSGSVFLEDRIKVGSGSRFPLWSDPDQSFIGLMFCQFDLLSDWSFVGSIFCRINLLSDWCFVGLIFCRINILSDWCFFRSVFRWIDLLSDRSFVGSIFRRINLLSDWCFFLINLLLDQFSFDQSFVK